MISKIEKKFRDTYSETPLLLRSPGRVNLIGEHTDYNEGFVLPAAINRAIYFALSPRSDGKCSIHAYDVNDQFQCEINQLQKSAKGWPNYLLGVIQQLQQDGHIIPGFNCVFGGDIPIGAGLSSSAALEAGLAAGLNELFQLNIDSMSLVKLSQRAENLFVGVQCGIMDQLVNIFGQKDQVLRLDCRSLEFEYYPFQTNEVKIVLCDSQVQRALGSSEYNLRRMQCETGVRVLQKLYPGIESLRDITLEQLQKRSNLLDPTVHKRCKYVVEENMRVLEACAALQKKDFHTFGQKIYGSHRGLSQDYEVSCRELDILVEGASAHSGVLGSRMMGAGFGGCTINLVRAAALENFEIHMARVYRDRLKKSPKIYFSEITAGTAILKEKVMNV